MPSEYKKNGIAFAYPDNWHLEESQLDDGQQIIQLNSPQGAFWVLNVCETKAMSPEELAKSVLKTMQQEYRDLEFMPITKQIAGRTLTGYDMDFMCFDLVNTAIVLCFSDQNRTYSLFWQSDDQQLEICEDVFHAINFTFIDRLSRQVT